MATVLKMGLFAYYVTAQHYWKTARLAVWLYWRKTFGGMATLLLTRWMRSNRFLLVNSLSWHQGTHPDVNNTVNKQKGAPKAFRRRGGPYRQGLSSVQHTANLQFFSNVCACNVNTPIEPHFQFCRISALLIADRQTVCLWVYHWATL